jgi:Bacterial archaeo-eukaryotic release factor family 7
MDIVTRDKLEVLAQQRHRICISMFLPTHRAGAETRQDPIRLRNLMRECEARIVAADTKPMRAKELLAPARQLTEGSAFWRAQGDSLALYLADGFFEHFRLPLSLPERIAIGGRFDVKPLLQLFTAGGRFYLLGLSQKRVRLFEGTRFGMDEMDLQNVPQGVRDALKYDVREHQQQVHSGTGMPGARRKQGGVFHGQAVGVDDAKERSLEYFRQVDRGLRSVLKDAFAPLVLAGAEELFPIFREANTHRTLIENGVRGNPDGMRPDELQKAALKALEPYWDTARREALLQYQSLAGTARASNDLHQVLRAAFQGRIEFAFIPTDTERWGRFDAEQDALEAHETPQPGDEDLVNEVAIQTIIKHGAIYAIAPQAIPDASPVAAVFRYPQPA